MVRCGRTDPSCVARSSEQHASHSIEEEEESAAAQAVSFDPLLLLLWYTFFSLGSREEAVWIKKIFLPLPLLGLACVSLSSLASLALLCSNSSLSHLQQFC